MVARTGPQAEGVFVTDPVQPSSHEVLGQNWEGQLVLLGVSPCCDNPQAIYPSRIPLENYAMADQTLPLCNKVPITGVATFDS